MGQTTHCSKFPLWGHSSFKLPSAKSALTFFSGEWVLNPLADQAIYYLVQITKELSYIGKSIRRPIKVSTFCFVFHNIKQNFKKKINIMLRRMKNINSAFTDSYKRNTLLMYSSCVIQISNYKIRNLNNFYSNSLLQNTICTLLTIDVKIKRQGQNKLFIYPIDNIARRNFCH